jgi:hypothetical protein
LATTEWIVFGEDDCWYPPEYPATLIDHARRADALAISGSARLILPDMLDGPLAKLNELIRSAPSTGRHPPNELLATPWPVEKTQSGDLVTPLLTAGAAIQSSVFERVRFDPGFRGNAFREETDFFLSCYEAGIRTVRCPHAVCGHMKTDQRALGGGAWAMGRLQYGYHMAANNWRLLRKHAGLFRELRSAAGRPASLPRIQAEFIAEVIARIRRSPS